MVTKPEVGKWYLWSVSDAEKKAGRLDAQAGSHILISGRCEAPYYISGIFDAAKLRATHEIPRPEACEIDSEWLPRAFAEAKEMPYAVTLISVALPT